MNSTETDIPADADEAKTANRRYANLDEALQAQGVPESNHEFIRKFVDGLDVIGFYARSGYIKAIRRSLGPAIQIHSGYSTGFRSEMEIYAVLGDVEHSEGKRGWTVTHPRRKVPVTDSGKAPKQREIEYPICPECFMTLPATGKCDDCDV
ncbi:hypothetical protein [Gulosibacter molinativorax]|uniref:Uncharacterized protein n=1 Tax=Gulosibacter molinativorax TaxID=256821 RepID=A0ABT7CC59_9MICO|nr:hypothetical protein [Gulosibacter molinativorax]MDJ1372673.1 hypothetical protein [Gulosibacter molinativorax]QUY60986.1 Hypotetical protein [Gulosibacter molinativorax]